MAIFKIRNGQKVLMADVSPIKHITSQNGYLTVSTSDKIVHLTVNIEDRLNEIVDEYKVAIENLGIDYSNGVLNLLFEEKVLSSTALDVASQIEWIGLLKVENGIWQNWPAYPTVPTPDNGSYIVIIHKNNKNEITTTYANVSSLIDTYEAGQSISIINKVVSLKYDNTLNPANFYLKNDAIKWDIPKLPDNYTISTIQEGFYYDESDAEYEQLPYDSEEPMPTPPSIDP